MSFVIATVALIVLPASVAVLLLGPLRNASPAELVRLGLGVAVAAIGMAAVAALLLEGGIRTGLAVGALVVAPVAGTFAALRTEGVRQDRRLGFVLGPLGYLAGVAVAVWVFVTLGFAG